MKPLDSDDVARLRPLERRALLENLADMVATNDLRLGDAARLLRSSVLRMNRERFSEAVGVSKRAIAQLEDDPGANPTLQTLTRVFAPFGAKLGLVFPGLEAPEPAGEEVTRQRAVLRASLAKSHRRKRTR